MPGTASPNNELPDESSEPPTIKPDTENAISTSEKANNDVNDATTDENGVEAPPNGQLDATALPETNGNVQKAINGNGIQENGAHDAERPAKRQRTRDATPPPSAKKLKPVSPPWKKVVADGPTSYMENGRRKSGRTNAIPVEHQPPGSKRMTRRSLNTEPLVSPKRSDASRASRTQSSKSLNGVQKGTPRSGHTRTISGSSAKNTPKVSSPESRSSRSARRRSSPAPPPRSAPRARRESRVAPPAPERSDASRHSSRLASKADPYVPKRGRNRSQWSDDIPLVHFDQTRKRPKIGSSFEDFWQRAGELPVEDGGILASEDGPSLTDEMAAKEASVIMRIEGSLEPGGILSEERCAAFPPEGSEEPPRQWARQDHMTKAVSNFRKLLLVEQTRHRQTAKRIAEACREEWLKKQPKTPEQLEAEAKKLWRDRYGLVVKALIGTWENVRLEINRRRLKEWEAQEQQRVKAALNEAVNLSEQRLQARRADADSELLTDDEDLDLMTDVDMSGSEADASSSDIGKESSDEEDSDNMSSEDEDEDVDVDDQKDVNDEGLTQEQLREKYANIPDLEPEAEGEDNEENGDDTRADGATSTGESSDESVDMDDDMGSSMSDSSEDSEGSGDESENGGPDNLLGLFFNKSELEQMKADEPVAPTEDVEMSGIEVTNGQNGHDEDENENENEVSLITYPESDRRVSPSEPAAAPDAPEQNGDSSAPVPATIHDSVVPDQEQPQEPTANVDPSMEVDKASPAPDAEEIAQTHAEESAVVPSRASTSQVSSHRTDIPFLLRGTLREYQHDGLDWLAGLYGGHTNGILADEMGLGKTIQTIALLAHLACKHEVWGPHLVVVPTSVMLNWEMEFKKWCPGFKILAYYGTQEERKRKRQGWNNDDVWNVCITSYQLVLQDQQVFRRRRWHYMILDEAHNIKNFKSQRWQTLLGFNTAARLLLTGTPLQNNLTELWSLLFFLMPARDGVGGFADLEEFHDWFKKPESQILESGRDQMDEEAKVIITKLHKMLRPYLLRRLKADVEKQMPAKYEHVEFCRLSKRQRELYDGFLSRSDTRETLASGNYMSIINCLMQLRKVCNHPDLFVDRPITTSFRMPKSVAADFEIVEQKIRGSLLIEKPMSTANLGLLNLIPAHQGHLTTFGMDRINQLSPQRRLKELTDVQKIRAQNAYSGLDASTVESNLGYLENAARWGRLEQLRHCTYLNSLRRQQRPIYGKNLVDLVDIGAHCRPYRQRPNLPANLLNWFQEDSDFIKAMTPSVNARAESYETTIEKFSCVTPAVVTRNIEEYVLGRKGVEAFTDEDLRLSKPVRWAPFMPRTPPKDPWHEARMRLSIQFPDKRLLQYDCGKLQVLDKLLRKLQAGGHRALIFTQMTKVLDILEQFLNIHGHKYLRLDGATKVEQRQILTDRFNNDPRILCFILSTRSGGLGINLTGADTVIFYDQDWNPAMDKQCQDRCHRIGQTRDVHIYRLVSEHTIEANILRKASQKQMLDDVVIQEGEFTTDYFNKLSVRDVLSEKVDFTSEGVSAADAALDRVLGGPSGAETTTQQRTVGRVLEQAEDREDVAAARAAEREIQEDDADFNEKTASNSASGASTTRQGTPATKSVLEGGLDSTIDLLEEEVEAELNAWGEKISTIDDFMLGVMREALQGMAIEVPRDKKKGKKKGKDTRKR